MTNNQTGAPPEAPIRVCRHPPAPQKKKKTRKSIKQSKAADLPPNRSILHHPPSILTRYAPSRTERYTSPLNPDSSKR